MNRANVWTLCDLGDAASLKKAIRNVPSCVNVSGWSYAGGKRRGVGHNPANGGKWDILPGAGEAAPLLHYAVVRGSAACVLIALESGAGADTTLGDGTTADAIAEALGYADIVDVIRLARHRQGDLAGVLQEDEEKERRMVAMQEEQERGRRAAALADGLVDVLVTFRDGAAPPVFHQLRLPRYISYATVLRKVEAAVGQRVLLSFVVADQHGHDDVEVVHPGGGGEASPPIPSPTLYRSPSATTQQQAPAGEPSLLLVGGVSPIGAMGSPSLAHRQKKRGLAVREEKMCELNPRTTKSFLLQQAPRCIARPLAFAYVPNPTRSATTLPPIAKLRADGGEAAIANTAAPSSGAKNRSLSATPPPPLSPSPAPTSKTAMSPTQTQTPGGVGLIERLRAIEAKESDPQKRLEAMHRLVNEDEAPDVFGKRIHSEELDKCLQRLYYRAVEQIRTRRQEFETAVAEAMTVKVGTGTSEAAERMYGAVQQREEAVKKIAEQVMAVAAKPTAVTLPHEEVQAAAERLWKGSSEKMAQSRRELEKRIYGDEEIKRCDLASLVDSVYTKAVQRKKDAIAKMEERYGDFRRRKKSEKHLTEGEVKAMGDRLSAVKVRGAS